MPVPTKISNDKFSDLDLSDNPDLVELATQFARDYEGNFTFLLAARDHARADSSLPLGVARGVLNVMRNDPIGREMLPPERRPPAPPPMTPTSEPARAMTGVVTPAKVPKPKTPKPPRSGTREREYSDAAAAALQRPSARPSLTAKFKKSWLYSTHASANVAHLIDNERSRMVYDRDAHTVVSLVECLCRRPRYPSRFIQLTNDPPEEYTRCTKCLEAQANPKRRKSVR